MKDRNLFKSTAQTALNVNFTGRISFADSEPFELSPLLFSKKIVMPTGDSLFLKLCKMSKEMGIKDIFKEEVLNAVLTRYGIDSSLGVIATTKQLLSTSIQCPPDKIGLQFVNGKAVNAWIKTANSEIRYTHNLSNLEPSAMLREVIFALSNLIERRAKDLAKAKAFLAAAKATVQELGCHYELAPQLKNIDDVTSITALKEHLPKLLPNFIYTSESALGYCLASFLHGGCISKPALYEQDKFSLRACQPSSLAIAMNDYHQELFFKLFTNYTEKSW